MKKQFFVLFALFLSFSAAFAQGKYGTKDAKIMFHSDSNVEKIEGTNKSAMAAIDAASGAVQFSMLVKGFHFEKALMEEHFNENYMESTKYPKANFTGKITNLGDVKFGTPGTYNATVTGTLEIHGVKKEVTIPGTITCTDTAAKINTKFVVKCSDYGISIPSVVKDNISNDIQVTIDANLKKM